MFYVAVTLGWYDSKWLYLSHDVASGSTLTLAYLSCEFAFRAHFQCVVSLPIVSLAIMTYFLFLSRFSVIGDVIQKVRRHHD